MPTSSAPRPVECTLKLRGARDKDGSPTPKSQGVQSLSIKSTLKERIDKLDSANHLFPKSSEAVQATTCIKFLLGLNLAPDLTFFMDHSLQLSWKDEKPHMSALRVVNSLILLLRPKRYPHKETDQAAIIFTLLRDSIFMESSPKTRPKLTLQTDLIKVQNLNLPLDSMHHLHLRELMTVGETFPHSH